MIELLRDPDFAKVGFYQSVLEGAGIQTHIRNADGSNMAGVMIPDVYPALCIVNASDFEKAKELLHGIELQVVANAERLDKPWLVIWCSILLFGPIFVIGIIGLAEALYGYGDQAESTPAHASNTSFEVDVSDMNKPSTGFKLFASSTALLMGGFSLFYLVRLGRRSLLMNKCAPLEKHPKESKKDEPYEPHNSQ